MLLNKKNNKKKQCIEMIFFYKITIKQIDQFNVILHRKYKIKKQLYKRKINTYVM